jgi:hypothetical protein
MYKARRGIIKYTINNGSKSMQHTHAVVVKHSGPQHPDSVMRAKHFETVFTAIHHRFHHQLPHNYLIGWPNFFESGCNFVREGETILNSLHVVM